MIGNWGNWKPFPKADLGGQIEAPVGPGVYEVRHSETGELIAFGSSDNVAQSLATLVPRPASGLRAILTPRRRAALREGDFEYRICAARSASEARSVAENLRARREMFWRRRAGSAGLA